MQVVSLVPSWTETLIECGVDVVGRTRYCIHPADRVRDIPAVGGTKDLNWSLVQSLKPDLILLDKEENLPWMKEEASFRVLVTHVDSLQNLHSELETLAAEFRNQKLFELSALAKKVIQAPPAKWDFHHIPGLIEYLIYNPHSQYSKLEYIIWKNPWMKIGRQTFIQSVLLKLGAEALLQHQSESKYPTLMEAEFSDPGTFFLFSSEPFPFVKKKKELLDLNGALVDGESFSWFGIRSLRFLQQQLFK